MILDAAIDLFGRNGYRSTTIKAIADAVGVADASLMHHFDSKAAILEAALLRDEVVANRELLAQLAPGGLEAIRGLGAWGDRMAADPATTSLQIVLTAEGLNLTSELLERFKSRYRSVLGKVAESIQRGIDAGEIRPDVDAMHEAAAFVAFLDGIRVVWFYVDRKIDLGEQVRSYAANVMERIATDAGS
jgi:AcrR family transcriptional regulator